jgi:hypothetical protein
VIEAASARGHDSAALFIKPTTSALSAPVLYYLVTDIGSGEVRRVAPVIPGYLNLSGLSSESTYTFTIAAVNVDGSSAASLATPVIRTGTAPVVSTNTPAVLAAPAFTISVSAETKTVNNAIVGYTINSSGGGTVASYSISPAAPAGLTFDTSDGTLEGTPTSVASATAYTITATNASGSATRTFTLTVTAIVYTVGQTGPGGGKIFYVAPVGTTFACGPTLASSCTYLEAAPRLWNGETEDPTRSWATNVNSNQTTSVAGAVGTAIGFGYQNSAAIVAQEGNVAATSAAVEARAYSGNGLTDWYLPSKDELNELFQAKASVGEFKVDFYWSSSQHSTSNANAWAQAFSTGGVLSRGKNFGYYVRPIRAG